ncbi:MAG: iron uptake porin [Kastovskya adunca ATA6-11-RM4]|jgi:hypothetical protein|nr:iron uptake porin [Kastovskya adunca ATA6-11-RM4]
MSKVLWKSLLFSPAVLGATLVVSAGAIAAEKLAPLEAAQPNVAEAPIIEVESVALAAPTAPIAETIPEFSSSTTQLPVELSAIPAEAEPAVAPAADTTLAQAAPANSEVLQQINRYSQEGNSNSQDQVTNVTQLRDVSPGDWAYEALRELVERYGCIAGYPDGTFRGNRATTRFEFAAGLNSCLNQIERLIAASTADFVTRDDLETLQRLVQEFEAELATLGTRVDNLEGRVGFLEDNQFSTTTKLSGEAIFAVTDTFSNIDLNPFGGDDGVAVGDAGTNTVFGDRVRLTLQTSFTGRDTLYTRLAAGNLDAFNVAGDNISAEGVQTFNIKPGQDNDVRIDWLAYRFPFGSSQVYLAAFGGIHSDYVPTLNPYFEDYDGGNGALSTFASESPIYRIGGGAGAAVSLGAGPLQRVLGPSTITLGYLAGDAANPGEDGGFFNGDYAALAQLNFNLGDRIGIGATYVHGYHNTASPIFGSGITGDSQAINLRDGAASGLVGTALANNPALVTGLGGTPVVTNTYGVEAALRLSETVSISGFGSFTDAILIGQGGADIWSYGAGVAFSDFGKEGNILGIFGGVQPTLRGLDESIRPAAGFSRDNAYHIEAFYKYQLTENISVTPGVIWLTNPGQNSANDDAVIGTLRTTFTF